MNPPLTTEPTVDQVQQNLKDFAVANKGSLSTPVTALSTTQGKEALDTHIANHQIDLANIQASKEVDPNKAIIDAKNKENAIADARTVGGLSPEEIATLGGDVKNYDFHQPSGLYVPKGTTGGVSGLAPVSADETAINTAFDAQKGLVDASTQNVLKSISDLYGQRKEEQTKANTNATESFRNLGLRTGMSRYTGGAFKGFLSSVENAGLQKLTDISTQEAGKIAEAEQARTNNELTLFAKKREEINALRKEKAATIEKLRVEAVAENKKIKDQNIKSSRDGAIAGLLQQGITDPSQILEYLNYDDNGKLIGDFTAKEVADTLKSIAPDADLKMLDTNTRTFFVLKGHNQLPADIAALPEDQQLMAYLKAQKGLAPGAKASTKKITLSEAKSKGLPLSTIGMSEQDIVDSFQESIAPHWFTEKMQNEAGNVSLDPEVVSKTWEKYRQGFISDKAGNSTTRKPAPTPAVVGKVRAYRAGGATPQEVNDFINFKGYDPADPAFK